MTSIKRHYNAEWIQMFLQIKRNPSTSKRRLFGPSSSIENYEQ